MKINRDKNLLPCLFGFTKQNTNNDRKNCVALEIFLIVQNQPPCHKTASTSNDLSKNVVLASLIKL